MTVTARTAKDHPGARGMLLIVALPIVAGALKAEAGTVGLAA